MKLLRTSTRGASIWVRIFTFKHSYTQNNAVWLNNTSKVLNSLKSKLL